MYENMVFSIKFDSKEKKINMSFIDGLLKNIKLYYIKRDYQLGNVHFKV